MMMQRSQKLIRKAISRRSMSFIIAGDQNAFNGIEQNDKKKVLYFTASWCPPCKMIGPKFEKMAEEKEHELIDFVKVDVDDIPDAAQAYRVSGVPMFCFLDGSNKVSEFVGADETQLRTHATALGKK
jgi:thioredoxin 1